MNTKRMLASAVALFAAWLGLNSLAQENPGAAQPSRSTVAAAHTFLAALDEGQRSNVVFDFKDEAQRKRWSNLPPAMSRRAGLRMGDLTPAQRKAALGLLAAALSPQGYQKVLQIVEGDEVLRETDGGRGRTIFGRDEYYISLLGRPSPTDPWMIQFGGHHLGLNITLVGEQETIAPSHTGAQPAIYQFEGKTVKPLGAETEKASALLHSLDEAQRKQAVLGVEMRDLVLGPGRDGQMIQPEGIKGLDLTDRQREMLLDLIGEWTGIMHDAVAKSKMDELKQHISETWFAWSGPTDKPGAAYFRVQGPTVIIEYAPQRLGGNPANHIHTIYRDPTNDYGAKWWRR